MLIPLSRKNGGCPICGSDSGKCRQSSDNDKMILCMSTHGDDVPGYEYKGETTNGDWGIYVENGTEKSGYIKREKPAEPTGLRLPAKERGEAIDSIINQLPLDEPDRQDLLKRGFTPQQISHYGFFTIKKESVLSEPVNTDLAGIASDGRYFVIKQDDGPGYAIPIKNIDGIHVGWQRRLRNPTDGNRYKNAASYPTKNGSRKVKSEMHSLEYGTLPLQHSILYPQPGKDLYLSEAVLKSLRASLLHDVNVIGAIGGNFVTINDKRELEAKELENSINVLKPGRIILFPDAESLINTSVLRKYRNLKAFLESIGYDLLVSDWGQGYSKDNPDCDEIESGAYTVIPFGEWDDQPQDKPTVTVKTAEPVNKLELTVNGETKQLSPAEPLTYKGDVLTITDRYDLPNSLTIPSFFDRENAGKLVDQVENYRRLGCHSFHRLPMDKLRDLAKENNIRTSLNKSEAIDKIVRLLGTDRTELEGKTSEQLKVYAKENGIKNLFGINSYELAERLEVAGVSKDGLSFKDNLVLTIKVDHPSGGFIAGLIESLNDLDDPKYDIVLPFDLIREGQYLNHKKAVRNDPKAMQYSATFTNWKQAKKYTPDKITRSAYLTESDLLRNIDLTDGQIHAILSALGTGKTTLMIELTKVLQEKYPDYHLIIVSYRNGLVFNTVSKMQEVGLPMREGKDFKDNVGYVKKNQTAWVGACFDSFLDIDQKMHSGWEKKAVFIFDEVDSVVNHILFSTTCKARRIPSLSRLLECLTASAGILALSGTLNNTCLRFFDGTGKNLIKYQNITDRPKIPVRWILGSSDDTETDILKIKEKDNLLLVDNITARIKSGERIIISADSQKQCQRIHLYLDKIFDGKKKILRIDRKTRSKDETSAFVDSILRNPQKLAELGYDILIYNSSAESGVDISFDQEKYPNYFSHHFHFGYGIVSIDSNIQLLRRYRGGCPITIWMAPTSNNKAALLQGNDLIFDRRTRMIESGLTKVTQPTDYICELADDLAYHLAYERSNLRQCMLDALGHHGYEIEFICNSETDTDVAEETKEIEEENANDIFTADDKFIGENLAELKDDDQNYDNQMAIAKAFYFQNFYYSRDDYDNGNYPLFDIENIIAIEKTHGSFWEKCKNHIYINLPKSDLKLLQKKKYSDAEHPIFYRDVKRVALPLSAIQKSGLSELLKVDAIGTDDPIFDRIRKYAKKHPLQWKTLCQSDYSDKWFFVQVKTILDSHFGLSFSRIKTDITIGCGELIKSTIDQITPHILERLENIKNNQEPVTPDGQIENEAVVMETAPTYTPAPSPAPQPAPVYAVVGYATEERLVNPWDLVNINGQQYVKCSEVTEITQQLPVNRLCQSEIVLPDYISSRVEYNGIDYTATKFIDGGIRFTNNWDYRVIDYYPSNYQIRYHNSLLG